MFIDISKYREDMKYTAQAISHLTTT